MGDVRRLCEHWSYFIFAPDRGVRLHDAQAVFRLKGSALKQVAETGATTMPTSLKCAVDMYLQARNPARGTRCECHTTVKKWLAWKGKVPLERLDRPTIRKFLSWVHDRALADGGSNPGRTANKARTHIRAVVSWAWENDFIDVPPRFPKPLPTREVAGRHYLTKTEINALLSPCI